MDERREKQLIQQAFETSLSGLKDDPWLARRVIAQARETERKPVKVKRKLSVGLIVMIALMLVTVTAVAVALLSMREIVEEQAVPIANQYEGDSYTVEDTNLLLQLAEENGIELSENARNSIIKSMEDGEGYPKEEMLMALARAEFGESYDAWTLAQKKWFDDVCNAIGYVWETQNAMPEGGEEAKYAIIEQAEAYLIKEYEAEGLDDESRYTMSISYIDGTSDGSWDGNYWSVGYSALRPEDNGYGLTMEDDGTVIKAAMYPGVNSNMTVDEIYVRYRRCYRSSDDSTWDQSTLRAMQKAMLNAEDTYSMEYLCMAQTSYPEIPADAISKEEAYAIAANYLDIEDYEGSYGYFIGASPNPVWKVKVPKDDERWTVEVDAMDGSVKTVRLNTSIKWWVELTLCETYESVSETWEDPRESVG